MVYFEAKMHQIRFALVQCTTIPDPPAGLQRPKLLRNREVRKDTVEEGTEGRRSMRPTSEKREWEGEGERNEQ